MKELSFEELYIGQKVIDQEGFIGLITFCYNII